MTLIYLWEDVTVHREVWGYNVRSISPHTRPSVEDVRYEYEKEPTDNDIMDYLIVKGNPNVAIQREQMEKLLDLLNSVGAIDYSKLEEDDDFVAYMTERYADEAWEDFVEGNDSY